MSIAQRLSSGFQQTRDVAKSLALELVLDTVFLPLIREAQNGNVVALKILERFERAVPPELTASPLQGGSISQGLDL